MEKQRQIKCTVRGFLSKNNFITFYDKFHDNSNDDIFRKKLTELTMKYKQLFRSEDTFRTSYNNDGFYFKTDHTLKCEDDSKPCIIDQCLYKNIIADCYVTPYNFKNNSGLSIKVKTIRVLKSKN